MPAFFIDTVNDIPDAITFAAEGMDNLKYVILADGFGRCSLIKSGLLEALVHLSTAALRAREPDLCIVKRAAMFGCAIGGPTTSRKSKCTFRISVSEDFNLHSPKHRRNSSQKILAKGRKETRYTYSVSTIEWGVDFRSAVIIVTSMDHRRRIRKAFLFLCWLLKSKTLSGRTNLVAAQFVKQLLILVT